MEEKIFTVLYEWINGAAGLAVAASFLWGILSVLLSPCHLSSIPLIVGYISNQGKMSGKRALTISLIFALGILASIGIAGYVTAMLGRMLGDTGPYAKYIVAVVFIAVGLYMLDVIKLNFKGMALKQVKGAGFWSILLLGLIFGIALGPCTFAYMAPVLGIVFQAAGTNFLFAAVILTAFGLGHCFVIVSAGALTGFVQKYVNWSEGSPIVKWTKRICGVLVILGGIYFLLSR
jgi:cytochrome c-type biogenesis protein